MLAFFQMLTCKDAACILAGHTGLVTNCKQGLYPLACVSRISVGARLRRPEPMIERGYRMADLSGCEPSLHLHLTRRDHMLDQV